MTKKYDVLIIGDGPVGTSLVCALHSLIKHDELKVCLVRTYAMNGIRDASINYNSRASALSYGTRLIYEQLSELWSEIAPYATAIFDIKVSDRGYFGSMHLNHKEEFVPALGYVIENFHLNQVLLKKIQLYRKQTLIDIICPANVAYLKPLPNAAMLIILKKADGKHLELIVALVVLADGGRSGLMNQLGIVRKRYDYQQHALITNVSVDQPHQGIAYEKFSGNGSMALLPLTGNRFALVWTMPSSKIKEKMELNDSAILQEIQKVFERIGNFIKLGKREIYHLVLNVAREQVRPGLVILGNAAHTIHPVAGQGYNLAIRDTIALVNNIDQSLKQKVSPGLLARLLSYVNGRVNDQRFTLNFCDKLVKLFSRKELPVILARNIGLVALDSNRTLKSKFARKAMGL